MTPFGARLPTGAAGGFSGDRLYGEVLAASGDRALFHPGEMPLDVRLALRA